MMKMFSWVIVSCVVVVGTDLGLGADRIRFAYPAKSLNYLPIMLGRDKGIYQTEGIDLQMVLVTSPVQVTALTTADIDFSGAQSQVMAGAARGLPVKVVGFITTKPSFWLVAKPELKAMLPVPISTPGFDNGPYLTSANWVTKDPDTGIFNIGNYRSQIKAPNRNGGLFLGQHMLVSGLRR